MSKRLTTEEVLGRFYNVHGDKYDYSKVEYKSIDEKVCIVCPTHGEFWQTPYHHLTGNECPLCARKKVSDGQRFNTEQFIQKAREVHGDKYDYSKVDYVNNSTKVCIICKEHGEFWQRPDKHFIGQGCPICKQEKIRKSRLLTTNEFIKRAKLVHGNMFDYSSVEYVNARTPIKLLCKTCNNFFMMSPKHFLRGHSCTYCNESFLENKTRMFLEENDKTYEKEKIFEFDKRKRIDFYLSDINIAIECQGIQHFKPIDYFGGDEALTLQIQRDKDKNTILTENNIKLYYIVNDDINIDSLNKDLYTNENTFHISDIEKIFENH